MYQYENDIPVYTCIPILIQGVLIPDEVEWGFGLSAAHWQGPWYRLRYPKKYEITGHKFHDIVSIFVISYVLITNAINTVISTYDVTTLWCDIIGIYNIVHAIAL